MNGLRKVRVLVRGFSCIMENGESIDGKEFDALITLDGSFALIPAFNNFAFVPISYVQIIKEESEVKDFSGGQSLCASIGAVPKSLTINF